MAKPLLLGKNGFSSLVCWPIRYMIGRKSNSLVDVEGEGQSMSLILLEV
jgi:hypothetical protein